MWSFIVVMVLILALAAAVVTYVAFPYRGYEVPGGRQAAQVAAQARQGVVRARGAVAQVQGQLKAKKTAADESKTTSSTQDVHQLH